jgi:hypothetical protein
LFFFSKFGSAGSEDHGATYDGFLGLGDIVGIGRGRGGPGGTGGHVTESGYFR